MPLLLSASPCRFDCFCALIFAFDTPRVYATLLHAVLCHTMMPADAAIMPLLLRRQDAILLTLCRFFFFAIS